MVSNDEVSESENGLLVCVNCEYSYALEYGESPDDFILECSCGGKLDYKPKREIITKKKGYAEKKSFENKFKKNLGLYTCIFGGLVSVILILLNMLVFGIIILFFSVLIGYSLYSDGKSNGKSWNKGIAGEKTVANYLNQLPEDYFIFNDVKFPGSYGNLDHIVIGPNGIFVIETKNFDGFFTVEEDGWYYKKGEYLKKAINQPGSQVMRNVMSLKEFFEKNDINMYGVWIDPIVTMVNKNFKINNKPKNYKVLYPSTIPKYILNKKKNPDLNILQSAIDLLEPYCNELSYLDLEDRY